MSDLAAVWQSVGLASRCRSDRCLLLQRSEKPGRLSHRSSRPRQSRARPATPHKNRLPVLFLIVLPPCAPRPAPWFLPHAPRLKDVFFPGEPIGER